MKTETKVKKEQEAPKKKKERRTEVLIQEYKGKMTFSIHDSDRLKEEEGKPGFKTLVIGFGIEKAKAILKHLDDLREYVDEEG